MWQSLIRTVGGLPEGGGHQSSDHLLIGNDEGERRSKPRIEGPFSAIVHGVDAGGETFEVYTVIDNLSARGLYLRLNQRLEPGTTLFTVTSLLNPGKIREFAPRLALHGVVLRTELKPGGVCGVAVVFSHHRFL